MGLNHACDFLKVGSIHWKLVRRHSFLSFFSFPTVASLYMLVGLMLFPTTLMILVSTNKMKKYTLSCYFKSEASPQFRFPQAKNKNVLYYYYSYYHYYYYYYHYYYLYFNSKTSLCLRFSQTKIRICFIFLTKSMFSGSKNRYKNILHFLLQIKTKSQANLIKPTFL